MYAMFIALAFSAPADTMDDAAMLKMYADCSKVCSTCQDYCAKAGPEHARSKAACHGCALVCGAASQIDSRPGTLAPIIRAAAGEACAACATECEKMPDDKTMAACAKSCRECAKMSPEKIGKPKAKPKKDKVQGAPPYGEASRAEFDKVEHRHHKHQAVCCETVTTSQCNRGRRLHRLDQCGHRFHRQHRLFHRRSGRC